MSEIAELIAALRAWGPLVSSGHEVPAAGGVMHRAADQLESYQRVAVASGTIMQDQVQALAVAERNAAQWFRGSNQPRPFRAERAAGSNKTNPLNSIFPLPSPVKSSIIRDNRSLANGHHILPRSIPRLQTLCHRLISPRHLHQSSVQRCIPRRSAAGNCFRKESQC